MASLVQSIVTVIARGSTIEIDATFTDPGGNVVQPPSAQVNLVYQLPGGGVTTVLLPMAAPAPPAAAWTALWDSQPAGPGTVFGSVMSGTPVPIAVADFNFLLSANAANIA